MGPVPSSIRWIGTRAVYGQRDDGLGGVGVDGDLGMGVTLTSPSSSASLLLSAAAKAASSSDDPLRATHHGVIVTTKLGVGGGKQNTSSVADGAPLLYEHASVGDWTSLEQRLAEKPSEAAWVDRCRNTALHLACRRQPPPDTVRDLLKAYPEGLRKRTVDGLTPLHFACCCGASLEVVRILLEEGSKLPPITNDDAKPKKQGIRRRTKRESTEAVAKSSAAATLTEEWTDRRGRTPLHHACAGFRKMDRVAVVEALLKQHPESAMAEDDRGRSALSLIFDDYAEEIEEEVIRQRRRRRASVASTTSLSMTSLGEEESVTSVERRRNSAERDECLRIVGAVLRVAYHDPKFGPSSSKSDDSGSSEPFRMLHAAVGVVPCCPPSFVEWLASSSSSLSYFPGDDAAAATAITMMTEVPAAEAVDSRGDTALHVAVSVYDDRLSSSSSSTPAALRYLVIPPPLSRDFGRSSSSSWSNTKHNENVCQIVKSLYNRGRMTSSSVAGTHILTRTNNAGKAPLAVALASGHRWDAGLSDLWEATAMAVSPTTSSTNSVNTSSKMLWDDNGVFGLGLSAALDEALTSSSPSVRDSTVQTLERLYPHMNQTAVVRSLRSWMRALETKSPAPSDSKEKTTHATDENGGEDLVAHGGSIPASLLHALHRLLRYASEHFEVVIIPGATPLMEEPPALAEEDLSGEDDVLADDHDPFDNGPSSMAEAALDQPPKEFDIDPLDVSHGHYGLMSSTPPLDGVNHNMDGNSQQTSKDVTGVGVEETANSALDIAPDKPALLSPVDDPFEGSNDLVSPQPLLDDTPIPLEESIRLPVPQDRPENDPFNGHDGMWLDKDDLMLSPGDMLASSEDLSMPIMKLEDANDESGTKKHGGDENLGDSHTTQVDNLIDVDLLSPTESTPNTHNDLANPPTQQPPLQSDNPFDDGGNNDLLLPATTTEPSTMNDVNLSTNDPFVDTNNDLLLPSAIEQPTTNSALDLVLDLSTPQVQAENPFDGSTNDNDILSSPPQSTSQLHTLTENNVVNQTMPHSLATTSAPKAIGSAFDSAGDDGGLLGNTLKLSQEDLDGVLALGKKLVDCPKLAFADSSTTDDPDVVTVDPNVLAEVQEHAGKMVGAICVVLGLEASAELLGGTAICNTSIDRPIDDPSAEATVGSSLETYFTAHERSGVCAVCYGIMVHRHGPMLCGGGASSSLLEDEGILMVRIRAMLKAYLRDPDPAVRTMACLAVGGVLAASHPSMGLRWCSGALVKLMSLRSVTANNAATPSKKKGRGAPPPPPPSALRDEETVQVGLARGLTVAARRNPQVLVGRSAIRILDAALMLVSVGSSERVRRAFRRFFYVAFALHLRHQRRGSGYEDGFADVSRGNAVLQEYVANAGENGKVMMSLVSKLQEDPPDERPEDEDDEEDFDDILDMDGCEVRGRTGLSAMGVEDSYI